MAGASLSPGAARGFNCPSCGAAVQLRGMAWTQTVACASCGAVIDARDPNLRILQEAQRRVTVQPLIPLGTRGEWRGAPYEAIGFQQRTISAEGVQYSWREYLLFNPYRGFRYLTEYDGHWNDVVPLPSLPATRAGIGRPTASYGGVAYKHFQTAQARTTFVLGEFPWEVRVGDVAETRDYVAPPRVLSSESTGDEITWSLGTYVDGQSVWRAFRLQGAPPPARGVYANQPSVYAERARSRWKAFGLLAALTVGVLLYRLVSAANDRVYEGRHAFGPMSDSVEAAGSAFGAATRDAAPAAAAAAAAFVTPPFELRGGTANVVVETEADVENEWLYVQYALVNEATGRTRHFAREVSYFRGTEGGESYTEGSRRDHATLGAVPAGRYVLRGEATGQTRPGHAIAYTVRVRRDVPSLAYYLIALLALVVPPVFGSLQAVSFETRRWAESDYAPSVDTGEDDEEDEE